ncbi:FAD-binding protein [Pseudomaricurvus alkylphenolicus]|uniref:D-arabinono-1,4-lactone oxidase n=1 Tax=Pseudomaricurvus alkylphenolicus TaxID=1306991 RepID=UPI00141EBB85|nr:D-arabinono-1,4-lactone oxidase [Pseudomaricurvus alkylphenolicus]NIB42560.1 FAD-binding protein [Pseudomaricurvus alkylphenolicus]
MTLTRRHTLKAILLASAAAAAPGISLANTSASRRAIPWKNWAGTQSCTPAFRSTPKGINELASVIKSSTGSIRAVGSGHSWSPLVPTDGTLLSLRRFKGMLGYDKEKNLVKFGAGTKLNKVGPALEEQGMAMCNLPDIDEQSLAGAFATGTHGTGLELPALHDCIESLTLVTAGGDVVECSRTQNAELFDAARVSLGSLGIIADYTLKTPDLFRVERKYWLEDLDSILDRGEQLARDHRHFEFFYIPFSDTSYCFTTDKTNKPITEVQPEDDSVVETMKNLRDTLSFSTTARRVALKALMKTVDLPPDYVEVPWKTLSTERTTPVYEMEYQLPLEAGPQAMREVVDYIETNHPEFFVPLEYRYVDGDDAWMSEFYGRKSVSISVHRYREGDDPWNVFTKVQEIFRKYEGRPHWGKVHNYTYQDLKSVYPKIDEFKKIRQELDPEGKFLNDHVRGLLGLEA